MTVTQRFSRFLSNITLTWSEKEDGEAKHRGVCNCLNQHYYGLDHETQNGTLVGSWGKGTRVRPPRDVDLLFRLPDSVYWRFQQRSGNRQSALLQEVKQVLQRRYPRTDIRGDGPVVKVNFGSYNVELVPGFWFTSLQYGIPITASGGHYKAFDPYAETQVVESADKSSSGNGRNLIRMAKRWQDYCNVPMKSFWIELLAAEFIVRWPQRNQSVEYYDWMSRDFFGYIFGRTGGVVTVPGTGETLPLGYEWKSRAQSAWTNAHRACNFETKTPRLAGCLWQEIYGEDIPIE